MAASCAKGLKAPGKKEKGKVSSRDREKEGEAWDLRPLAFGGKENFHISVWIMAMTCSSAPPAMGRPSGQEPDPKVSFLSQAWQGMEELPVL